MLEASPSSPVAWPIGRDLKSDEIIAALRQQGGERFDPVRFRFIEGVARRLPTQAAAVRQTLDDRLVKALAEYRERFERAQNEGRDTANRMTADHRSPLAELVRLLAHHSPDEGREAHNAVPSATGSGGAETGASAELKSLSYFRDTWSKLSVDRQLTEALAQGPENAGPLNSHLLVLQSLKRLRELSPDYLNRVMSYVDTLLWLDQASGGTSIRKNVTSGDSDKKRKPGRAKSK